MDHKDIKDHPDIVRLMTEGVIDDLDSPMRCPVCGGECYDIYLRKGNILCPVGCDICIEKTDIFEFDKYLYSF